MCLGFLLPSDRTSSRVPNGSDLADGPATAGPERVCPGSSSPTSGDRIASIALAGLLLLMPSIVFADSALLEVRATVVDSCRIDSVTPLQFPSYMVSSAQAVTGEADLFVACAAGTPIEISLDPGGNADGSMRNMSKGGNYIQYNLYTDSGYGTVWGDDLFGGGPLASTTLFNSSVFTIRGRIPAAQTAPAGDYTDAVTITLIMK